MTNEMTNINEKELTQVTGGYVLGPVKIGGYLDRTKPSDLVMTDKVDENEMSPVMNDTITPETIHPILNEYIDTDIPILDKHTLLA